MIDTWEYSVTTAWILAILLCVSYVSTKLMPQRAGGDIKRNDGPDPYSYVPIGQATKGKKGSHAPRINLTNKKKGSSGRR